MEIEKEDYEYFIKCFESILDEKGISENTKAVAEKMMARCKIRTKDEYIKNQRELSERKARESAAFLDDYKIFDKDILFILNQDILMVTSMLPGPLCLLPTSVIASCLKAELDSRTEEVFRPWEKPGKG